MNRADLLYEALKDGKPRTRREIFEAVGEFFMTNNAATELRARGYDVVHFKDGRLDAYQLVGLLDAGDGTRAEGSVAPVSCIEQSHAASPAAAQPSGDTSAEGDISVLAGNGNTSPESPDPSAPVWPTPATFAPAGGPADGIHGAGAEQLSIIDAIEAAA